MLHPFLIIFFELEQSLEAHLNEDESAIDELAAQLPLEQISTIPLEDILGEIPESRCEQYMLM